MQLSNSLFREEREKSTAMVIKVIKDIGFHEFLQIFFWHKISNLRYVI